jgi:hypothetical protein
MPSIANKYDGAQKRVVGEWANCQTGSEIITDPAAFHGSLSVIVPKTECAK